MDPSIMKRTVATLPAPDPLGVTVRADPHRTVQVGHTVETAQVSRERRTVHDPVARFVTDEDGGDHATLSGTL